jgi:hypothetical protein
MSTSNKVRRPDLIKPYEPPPPVDRICPFRPPEPSLLCSLPSTCLCEPGSSAEPAYDRAPMCSRAAPSGLFGDVLSHFRSDGDAHAGPLPARKPCRPRQLRGGREGFALPSGAAARASSPRSHPARRSSGRPGSLCLRASAPSARSSAPKSTSDRSDRAPRCQHPAAPLAPRRAGRRGETDNTPRSRRCWRVSPSP